MRDFFKHLITVEEIKAYYRKLAFKYHPDQGGDLETMKILNEEYIEALRGCDGKYSKGQNDKEYKYNFDENLEKELVEKLSALLSERLIDCEIALIGSWIWITGNTKNEREKLKKNGCKYHATKQCWFWNATPWRGGRSQGGLYELAQKYGYRNFKNAEQERLSA